MLTLKNGGFMQDYKSYIALMVAGAILVPIAVFLMSPKGTTVNTLKGDRFPIGTCIVSQYEIEKSEEFREAWEKPYDFTINKIIAIGKEHYRLVHVLTGYPLYPYYDTLIFEYVESTKYNTIVPCTKELDNYK